MGKCLRSNGIRRLLWILAWLAGASFAGQAQAALTIDSATVDGGSSTSVAPGATVSVSLTVTTSGGGASNDWRSTGWRIAGASGPFTCVNHADYLSSGTFTETFNATAPAAPGTYNLYLVAYRSDTCSGGGSSGQFVLPNAVIVAGGNCGDFRDDFSSGGYAGQSGSFNWSTSWIEVGDDGAPGGGTIRVAAGVAQFAGNGSASNPLGGPYLQREANLTGFSGVTLSFTYYETGTWEGNDRFSIHVSNDGGASWTQVQQFSNDQGSTPQNFSVDISAYVAANTRVAFVERANDIDEIFYIDNVRIFGCRTVTLDHFRITPATTAASTCLPNAITIAAEDASNNLLTGYTGTVAITTSSLVGNNHGNWSINTAANVTVPNPDNDDDGAVGYTFVAADAGDIVLDLSNTHAETLTITVSDPALAVASTSVAITFADNVFVITEDPVQVAGRAQAMSIAMWTNDGSNCFIDTNYDYNSVTLTASIDRAGVLPGAADPTIGAATIPDAPGSAGVTLDFSATPGQASFTLGTSDVGQYRLTLVDNTNVHADVPISGTSALLTVRPFGLAVTAIEVPPVPTPNPGGTLPASAVFTVAGGDFSATAAGVLWDLADDGEGGIGDGVIDAGRSFADNAVAPSYAWDTTLAVSGAGFTPATGAPGGLNNGAVPQAAFAGGSTTVTNLQYTEVGSFTLQSSAADFLGEPTADIVGDDIIVGRFIPADFAVAISGDGAFAETCGAFTYLGQDFTYATAPTISVSARNALGAITAQYRDGFARLGATSVTADASQDDTTPGSDASPLPVSYTAAAMAFTVNNDGTVDYTFGADTLRYGPDAPLGEFSKSGNSQVAPFVADINPEISQVADPDVTTLFAPGTLVLDPTGNNLRFGRLRMENTHGSEVDPLRMPAFVEYWTGNGFARSLGDACTAIADGDLVANPIGFSTPTVINNPASAGSVDYNFPAPGAGNAGFVDTTTNLSSANHLWLRFDWDIDGVFDNDPVARATFGIYDGSPVQIYIQQVYE